MEKDKLLDENINYKKLNFAIRIVTNNINTEQPDKAMLSMLWCTD